LWTPRRSCLSVSSPNQRWYANTVGQAVGTEVSTDVGAGWRHTFGRTPGWSYAGLSSGGFAAAYLPLIGPARVHDLCGLSGYYDAQIPPIAHASTVACAAASATLHPGPRTRTHAADLRA